MKLSVLDLFSGIGGFSLGLERTGGFATVAFCETDSAAQRVLRRHWPHVPVHSDVRKLHKGYLNEQPIVICGGFPCQDVSVGHVHTPALGLVGERSGLWYEYERIIGEFRPSYVIIENVAMLRSRGLEEVLGGLAALGYDAEWHCVPATYIGAAHQRDRVWIIANPSGLGVEGLWSERIEKSLSLVKPLLSHRRCDGEWEIEPDLRRSNYGVSTRLDGRLNSWGDRLKQCGNAIVPQMAEVIGHAILSHYRSAL